MLSTNSKPCTLKELKRDPFDYPAPSHMPPNLQKLVVAHRVLFSQILAELRRMYGSNRYISLAAQDLETAEAFITKAAEFYGENK